MTAYQKVELNRWRRRLRLPMRVDHTTFAPTGAEEGEALAALLVIVAAQAGLSSLRMASAMLAVVWEHGADQANTEALRTAAKAAGFQQTDRFIEQAAGDAHGGDAATAEYEANTLDAIEDGVLGVPWFKHYGQRGCARRPLGRPLSQPPQLTAVGICSALEG